MLRSYKGTWKADMMDGLGNYEEGDKYLIEGILFKEGGGALFRQGGRPQVLCH